jgi:hypothetical protein
MTHDALWEALEATLEIESKHRRDLEAVVAEAAAAPRHALSPWALWMLIGVARHVRRQQRAVDVVQRGLGVSPAAVVRGLRGLPRGARKSGQIDVSAEYHFHERGLRFRDLGRHETLDVDLLDGDTEHVDAQLLAECLRSIPGHSDGDARLWSLHHSCETFAFAFDELGELGLLEPHPEASHLQRLSAEATRHHDLLLQVGHAYDRADWMLNVLGRLAVTARAGDWVEADRIARVHRDRAPWARVFTRARAAEQQAQRRERLLGYKPENRDGTVITALIELDPMAAAEHVREALAGPRDQRCVAAMREIRHRIDRSYSPNPDYSAEVIALFRRLDPEGADRDYAIWPLCAGFLLDRKLHVDEVIATFASLGDFLACRASLLAFEHAPGLAIPLLRRALRGSSPVARADAAAILAQFGEPWCASMLAEALEASDDFVDTLECRAALHILQDPDHAARAWEAAYPIGEAEEEMLVRVQEYVRARMGDLEREVNPIQIKRQRERQAD